ncbi:Site-specific DNA recombinase [Corynebacterium pollutisoli]|uniref:Site-specific DNA recombinase n=1 Tax=Corynebacterium pollutisoli TaxID=1610489 RepID=A0A1X7HZ25_9CORY|nr:recombinase family protein [Corynebacterium pollutisoli]SMG06841.1 Site-specific DNA recombinase [Corynebacterium pollutisoli]
MNVLIYARVSHDKSAQGRSVAEQIHETTQWAERENWTVAEIVQETGSASRYARKARHAWDEVMDAIKERRVDAVLTWEASRATRDLAVYGQLREACAAHGVRWGYSGTLYDLRDRSDRFRTGLDMLMAEDEAARTSERVQRSMRAMADRGQPHGKLLYGYTRTYGPNRELISIDPHPEQAPIVQEIYQRTLAGDSLYAIAQSLNKRGIPTRRPVRNPRREGQGWITQSIKQVLKNPAYAGLRVHQGEVVGPAAWDGLINHEDWEKVQTIFLDPKRKTRTGDTTARHLLSGIATCGVCGSAMLTNKQYAGRNKDKNGNLIPTKDRDTYLTYLCKGPNGTSGFHVSMKEEHLDLLVTEAILARLERPDFLPALGEGDRVREEEREALLAEIAELQAWLEKVRERALDERDLDLLFDQERRVKPKISELQERAKELTSLDPVVKELAEAENIRVHWEALSLEDQRRVIRMLVVPVVGRATPGTRGRKGPRPDRVRLHWR